MCMQYLKRIPIVFITSNAHNFQTKTHKKEKIMELNWLFYEATCFISWTSSFAYSSADRNKRIKKSIEIIWKNIKVKLPVDDVLK